ncbi:MAG: hypothetical protein IJS93_02135 [Clostridia bacterium]|nr:hypothetical protein [Clostridia bacterium]
MNNYDRMHRGIDKPPQEEQPKKPKTKGRFVAAAIFIAVSAAVLLICFKVFGEAAAKALYGVFGVAMIAYAIIGVIVGTLLLLGFKPKRLSLRNSIYLAVLCILIVLFMQIISTVNAFNDLGEENSYGAYLSACYSTGNNNAGGAAFGVFAYPFLKWFGSVTSLCIIAVFFFGVLFLYFKSFFFEVQENKTLPQAEEDYTDMYVEELDDKTFKKKSKEKLNFSFDDEKEEEEYEETEARYAEDQYARLLDDDREDEEMRRFAQRTLFDDDVLIPEKPPKKSETPLKTGERTSEKFKFGQDIRNRDMYDQGRFERFLKGDETEQAEDTLFGMSEHKTDTDRKLPTDKTEIESILFGEETPSRYDFNYSTPQNPVPERFVPKKIKEEDVIDYSAAVTMKSGGLLDIEEEQEDDNYFKEVVRIQPENNDTSIEPTKEETSGKIDAHDFRAESYTRVITPEKASEMTPVEHKAVEDYVEDSKVQPYYKPVQFDPLPEVKPYYAAKEEKAEETTNDEIPRGVPEEADKYEKFDINIKDNEDEFDLYNELIDNSEKEEEVSETFVENPEEELFGDEYLKEMKEHTERVFGGSSIDEREAQETLFGVEREEVEREESMNLQEDYDEEKATYQPFPVRDEDAQEATDYSSFGTVVDREIPEEPQIPINPVNLVTTQPKPAVPQKKKEAKPERSPYVAPPLSILRDYPPPQEYYDHEGMCRRIEAAFKSYNIDCKVISYVKGPTFTQYAINLGDGVHFAKVLTLDKDMKRKLQLASPVNFVESVKGKDAIGLEIQNETRSKVELKRFINNSCFRINKKLYFILGVNIYGEPHFVDILDAPHMLIAGTTGSGKSICINTILTCILYNYTPDYVRLLLVDPKSVELSNFNEMPHNMLGRSITDCPTCIRALDYIINEMERRYDIMNQAQYKQLRNYNDYLISIGQKPLPYIVVVIDEYADLILHSKKTAPELDKRIRVLTAKSRAAGIHLILATQRPSTDVITGVIKNNVATRICFTMGDQTGSKVVLDRGGAEKLYGKGDMLFIDKDHQTPVRFQAPFLDDDEVVEITDNIRRNNDMDIDEDFYKYLFEVKQPEFTTIVEPSGGAAISNNDQNGDNGLDPLFWECVEYAVKEGVVSISKLQRVYNLGFQRGGRIVDEMEKRGFIEEPTAGSSKPRRVLIDMEELEYLRNCEDEE